MTIFTQLSYTLFAVFLGIGLQGCGDAGLQKPETCMGIVDGICELDGESYQVLRKASPEEKAQRQPLFAAMCDGYLKGDGKTGDAEKTPLNKKCMECKESEKELMQLAKCTAASTRTSEGGSASQTPPAVVPIPAVDAPALPVSDAGALADPGSAEPPAEELTSEEAPPPSDETPPVVEGAATNTDADRVDTPVDTPGAATSFVDRNGLHHQAAVPSDGQVETRSKQESARPARDERNKRNLA